jgi:hypothetical protein
MVVRLPNHNAEDQNNIIPIENEIQLFDCSEENLSGTLSHLMYYEKIKCHATYYEKSK